MWNNGSLMKIYLDHNLIVYLRNNSSHRLSDAIEKFKKNDCDFIFSPAHIEEIAVSFMRHDASKEIVDNDLLFLTTLCNKNSLRPATRDKVLYGTEYPRDCYKRVIEHYKSNDFAEFFEKIVIKDANENPLGTPKEMNNIAPEEVFNHINYVEMLLLSLRNNGLMTQSEAIANLEAWPNLNIKDKFCALEHSVNLASNWLEKMGYYRENVKKSRSRLHDVSHIIYGRYANVFVSNDKKLLKKAKAIYSLLGISTSVLTIEEFIEC